MPVKNPLHRKIKNRIKRSRKRVFIRADFVNLCGDYDQVGRALKQCVADGVLVRIGYGLYAKMRLSRLTGAAAPAASLPELGREALRRLDIKIQPSRAELANLEGRSSQVPTGRVVGVKSRISRKIGYNGIELVYERV